MPRFFTSQLLGEQAVIAGEDARHIEKALRMRPGEELILCDGLGTDYRCTIAEILPGEVLVRLLEQIPSAGEPAVQIRLYQALPKGEKMGAIVQKAVELGVSEIVPVLTARCVSRPDAAGMEKKRQRLQKIALEAAKQSGRGTVPTILPLQSFSQALQGMKQAQRAILLYERATAPLSGCLLGERPATLAVMIGSEGGFSEQEAALAQEQGIVAASLGRRILRCETAPVCALSAILFAYGEF